MGQKAKACPSLGGSRVGKLIHGPWSDEGDARGTPSNGQGAGQGVQYMPADSIGYASSVASTPWVAPAVAQVPPTPSSQSGGPVQFDMPLLTAGSSFSGMDPTPAKVPELDEVLREMAPGGIFAGAVPNTILDKEVERRPAPPPEYTPSELPAHAPIRLHQAMGQLSPEQNMHMLGLATVAVPVGVFTGFRYGGMYGGVAGALLAGAVVNGLRTLKLTGTPDSNNEAVISGTYALLGAALGGYLLWRGVKGKKS